MNVRIEGNCKKPTKQWPNNLYYECEFIAEHYLNTLVKFWNFSHRISRLRAIDCSSCDCVSRHDDCSRGWDFISGVWPFSNFFLNMGRERRWPRWIKKASHIGSKRLCSLSSCLSFSCTAYMVGAWTMACGISRSFSFSVIDWCSLSHWAVLLPLLISLVPTRITTVVLSGLVLRVFVHAAALSRSRASTYSVLYILSAFCICWAVLLVLESPRNIILCFAGLAGGLFVPDWCVLLCLIISFSISLFFLVARSSAPSSTLLLFSAASLDCCSCLICSSSFPGLFCVLYGCSFFPLSDCRFRSEASLWCRWFVVAGRSALALVG